MSGIVTVLGKSTLEKLGIDILTLSPDSHTKVLVRCRRCQEEFLREVCYLNLPHDCLKPALKWSQPSALSEQQYSEAHQWAVKISTGLDITTQDVLDTIFRQQWLCFYSRQELDFKPKSRIADMLQQFDEWLLGTTSVLGYSNDPILITLASDLGFVKGNLAICRRSYASVPPRLVRLEYRVVRDGGVPPTRKRITDAGSDLTSCEDITIPAQSSLSVNTGIQLACPVGYYYTIEGRSGLGIAGISPFRGIIDSTYCGDLIVTMNNGTDKPYEVKRGDRIAQIILHRCTEFDATEIVEFSPAYNQRGIAGFGSSGL